MKSCTQLFLLILLLVAHAATAQKEVEKADREYVALRYRNAIPIYLRALEKDSSDAEVVTKLADCLYKIRDYPNALYWYAKAVKMDPSNTRLALPYAQLLAANSEYGKAAIWYEKHLDEAGSDETARNFLDTYMHLDRFMDSSRWDIRFLNINTGYDEFSPSWFDGGLIFVSNRPRTVVSKNTFEWDRTPFLSLYQVADTSIVKTVDPPAAPHIDMDKYQGVYRPTPNDSRRVSAPAAELRLPMELPPVPKESVVLFNKQLESRFHEGPVSFNSRGDTIFMSRNNVFKGKSGKDKKGVNRLKIYSAIFRYGDWKDFTEFPYNSDEYSVGHPALTADGDFLYFVSDMPGGRGGSDIWYCRKMSNGWSAPVNAGPAINTKGNEMFPYISKDGTLYFSSDGKGGLGGLDIFLIRLQDDLPAGKAANLGYPVNSSRDDFGVLLNKDGYTGYFSSNRCGSDDLYYFRFVGPGYPSGIVTPVTQVAR
ncbi:tetratricopeptide repeat protein [Chitinophaga horti]|uniref:Tetratricopeptide repeat protein n=1 Tax=Chitinophaga horti TaxID=2920382 RepID=A0ABY6J4P0_9BACT|nr:tetratricopeptide repeat protein [Chitinophaga horti]UYQ94640.1 tetratricopeptide repeat protein [Chitinophaga horti]